MKKKALQEVLEACKKTGSLEALLSALSSNDEVGESGILPLLDKGDINGESLSELKEYYTALAKRYEEMEWEEPEVSEGDSYEEWEDALLEIEDEMNAVQEKIEELSRR